MAQSTRGHENVTHNPRIWLSARILDFRERDVFFPLRRRENPTAMQSMPRNDSICPLPPALFSGACVYHSHEQPPDPPLSCCCRLAASRSERCARLTPCASCGFHRSRSLAPFDPPDSHRACQPQKGKDGDILKEL